MGAVSGSDFLLLVETTPGSNSWVTVANFNSYGKRSTQAETRYPVFGNPVPLTSPGPDEQTYTVGGLIDLTDPGQALLRAAEANRTPIRVRVRRDGTEDGQVQTVLVGSFAHDARPESLQTISYELTATDEVTDLSLPIDAVQMVALAQSLGLDPLIMWRPEEFADGATGGAGSLAAPYWAKVGIDAPNLKLQGGASKVYVNGIPRIQLAGGGAWFQTDHASADLSLDLGFSVLFIATAQSTQSSLAVIQDSQGFGPALRRVGLMTDLGTENKRTYSLQYGSPSARMALRGVALDNNLRTWGFSVAPFVAGETGNRLRVQRSADIANEVHVDTLPGGRTTWAETATDVTQPAGANFAQFGSSGGDHIADQTETYCAILICRKQLTADICFEWQQYAKDQYGAFEETGEKDVFLGDSLNFSMSTGQPVTGDNDWSATTATGLSADLAGKLPVGQQGYQACWGGEMVWSILNHRMDFIWPIMLNARSRSKIRAHVNAAVNDLPWNAAYQEPGGHAQISANIENIMSQVRAYPNANRIKVAWNTVGPAWVDGAASPGDAIEVARVALNADMAAWPAGTVDLLHRIDQDATIGQPGQNMAGPYYDATDPYHTHFTQTPGYDYRRTLAADDIAALV